MTKLQQLLVKRFFGFVQSDTQPGLTWQAAYKVILQGGFVRRPTWKAGVRVTWLTSDRFFQVSNPTNFWKDKWTPYVEDFAATDWEIITEPTLTQGGKA